MSSLLQAPVSLVAVMLKELRQTSRDKRVLVILVVAPLIQLVVLGYAVDLDVNQVAAVVADGDSTPESRAFVRGLLAGDTFVDAGSTPRAADAVAAVTRGEAAVALILPRGFGEARKSGRPTSLQLLADGSDSNRAIVAQNAASAYAQQLALADAQGRLVALAGLRGQATLIGRVTVEPRVLYNPTLDSAKYFVPGVAATLLLIVSIIITAMGLAREREMGTLEQVVVTPIRPLTLVAGKTIPYGLIGLVDLGLVLAAAMLLFDVPIRGSLSLIFLGGALYMVSVLGIGLFVSILARNQQQAFMTAIFFVMPAILLSGFITPIANMPEWLQPVTALDPVRHFVEILRAVMLKGATLSDIAPQLVALGGIGATIFGLATLGLTRRLA